MSIFISEITFFIKLFDIFASNMEGCSVVFAFERILNLFFCSENLYFGRPKDLQCTFKINRDLFGDALSCTKL